MKKFKLSTEEMEKIFNDLQDKYRLSDMEVDMVYLKYVKKMDVTSLMRMVYAEYYPEKDINKVNAYTLNNVYCQHMKKNNVKMYIQDVIEEAKRQYKGKNAILSIADRMVYLSKIIEGEIKEPAQSRYGSIYQREADIKTKIQAINILNDFDLKSKELQTGSDFIINIVGEPIEMNKYKKVNNAGYSVQSDGKIKSSENEDLKDVM